jgi:predicted nucleotidyltransferase
MGQGSDIDILIIVPDSENAEEFKQKAARALGSINSKIDLNCVNEEGCYEMLNKPNELNVMNEILKNHLVLIGPENFYWIIRRWKND